VHIFILVAGATLVVITIFYGCCSNRLTAKDFAKKSIIHC